MTTTAMPAGLAAPAHKCTRESASQIAAQIPGSWQLTRLPVPVVGPRASYDVVTAMGPKTIVAAFSVDGQLMVLTCPYTGEHFVFVKGRAGVGAPRPGLGDTTTTAAASMGSSWPWIVGGLVVVVGAVVVADMAMRGHKESVEDEAERHFARPHARGPAARGGQARAYTNAVGRCFYKELRADHTPAQAAHIARGAVDRNRRHLVAMSHTGASVGSGCALLRRHAPIYYHE